MRSVLPLAGTFVVVLALVLGGAAVAPTVTGDTPRQSMPAIENPQYSDESVVANGTPGEADVTMAANTGNQTILIDPGLEAGPERPRLPFFLGSFGPETTERDVMPLVNVLVENGHEVRVYNPEDNRERSGPPGPGGEEEGLSPVAKELADADAFVTFRTDYSDEALEDIETFASEDGRVLVAAEPDDAFDEPGGAGLDSALGVTARPGYVYNLEENDLNYQRIYAEPTGDAAVTEGVDRVVFPTAAPVAAAGSANGTLTPTEGAELSTTRAATDAPVLVQRGNVVMVGDTDFLVPENTQRADTDVLVGNLADFLVTNDRNPGEQAPNPPEPEKEGPPGPRRPGGPEGGDRPPEPDSEPTPTPTPVE